MAGLKDKRGFIDKDRLDLSERQAVEYWMKRWGVTRDRGRGRLDGDGNRDPQLRSWVRSASARRRVAPQKCLTTVI